MSCVPRVILVDAGSTRQLSDIIGKSTIRQGQVPGDDGCSTGGAGNRGGSKSEAPTAVVPGNTAVWCHRCFRQHRVVDVVCYLITACGFHTAGKQAGYSAPTFCTDIATERVIRKRTSSPMLTNSIGTSSLTEIWRISPSAKRRVARRWDRLSDSTVALTI
jgi:hypothetical protein